MNAERQEMRCDVSALRFAADAAGSDAAPPETKLDGESGRFLTAGNPTP